jgi:nitric oxide dioxygenase
MADNNGSERELRLTVTFRKVSGGVGLTPMMSMIEAIAATTPKRPTWYVHGALNGRVHAMGAQICELAKLAQGIRIHTFYADPQVSDRQGEHYDESGLIKADWLARHTPLEQATYFLCGPKSFLRALVTGLRAKGVPADRARYELFGPADELMEAAPLVP